jgi:hypothetical protein
MAAGQGFKTFATGDVLSAADVNGYLMQGVLVFADSAERDAEITSPEEGQFAYLKDTNVTTYYTGSVWSNLDTTGMTNPMTTTGDVIYSSSGSTPARLGLGTAGQVLQVNSGATAPEWATPAAGGTQNWSLLNAGGTALSGTSTTVSGISGQGTLMIRLVTTSSGSANDYVYLRPNNDTGANYLMNGNYTDFGSSVLGFGYSNTGMVGFQLAGMSNAAGATSATAFLYGCNTSGVKPVQFQAGANAGGTSGNTVFNMGGIWSGSATVSSITISLGVGSFDSGTVFVYGTA